jgi:hypothetical protein
MAMEALGLYETSAYFYRTTLCHVQLFIYHRLLFSVIMIIIIYIMQLEAFRLVDCDTVYFGT